MLALWVPRDSSFISTQFLVLNLNGSFGVLSNKFIIFWYPIIIYYYINLKSSIISCLCSGDIYLVLSICFSFISELICGEAFKALVIFSPIFYPIKSPVASTVLNCSFWTVLSASVAHVLAWSKRLWPYLLVKILLMF